MRWRVRDVVPQKLVGKEGGRGKWRWTATGLSEKEVKATDYAREREVMGHPSRAVGRRS